MLPIDRLLLLLLIFGVWAMVLKPKDMNAHIYHSHKCNIEGRASGKLNGRTPIIEFWSGVDVICRHKN